MVGHCHSAACSDRNSCNHCPRLDGQLSPKTGGSGLEDKQFNNDKPMENAGGTNKIVSTPGHRCGQVTLREIQSILQNDDFFYIYTDYVKQLRDSGAIMSPPVYTDVNGDSDDEEECYPLEFTIDQLLVSKRPILNIAATAVLRAG